MEVLYLTKSALFYVFLETRKVRLERAPFTSRVRDEP